MSSSPPPLEPSPPPPPEPAGADATRFVLVEPSHAGNVGAAARAMQVMGFGELVLVAPRDAGIARRPEARALASGALRVLEAARTVATLDEALAGCTWACATAMTPRDFGPPTRAPRAHFAELAAQRHRVALVFGPERTGLSNDDVYRCHVCLSIPTDPAYGSLNLAQAVQLLAYDWRQAIGGFGVVPAAPEPRRADAAAVQGLLAHWARALQAIGFLDPAAPKKLLPRLRRFVHRAAPTVEEVHLLRGIARAAMAPRPPRRRGDPGADPAADPSAAAAPAPAAVPPRVPPPASVPASAPMPAPHAPDAASGPAPRYTAGPDESDHVQPPA